MVAVDAHGAREDQRVGAFAGLGEATPHEDKVKALATCSHRRRLTRQASRAADICWANILTQHNDGSPLGQTASGHVFIEVLAQLLAQLRLPQLA